MRKIIFYVLVLLAFSSCREQINISGDVNIIPIMHNDCEDDQLIEISATVVLTTFPKDSLAIENVYFRSDTATLTTLSAKRRIVWKEVRDVVGLYEENYNDEGYTVYTFIKP